MSSYDFVSFAEGDFDVFPKPTTVVISCCFGISYSLKYN